MNQLVDNNWNVVEEVTCQMDTLDNQLADIEKVDLLKIDVQGFEMEVIRGADLTLKKTRYLLIEWNFKNQYVGESSFSDIYAVLTQKYNFVLRDFSKPLIIQNQAIFSDALFMNSQI